MASVDEIIWSKEAKTSEDVSVLSIDSSVNPNVFFSDSLQQLGEDEQCEDVEASDDTKLTEDEIDNFLKKIQEKGVFCPIMAVREPFEKYFVQKNAEQLLSELSTDEDQTNVAVIDLFLASLFKSSYENLSIEDLREIASDIRLFYTQGEIEYIESKTKDQSSCMPWYRFRTGRVTASVFKKVCRTSVLSPSIPTIMGICYPERGIFHSKPTNYGKINESVARESYADGMRQIHTNFIIKLSGLVINNDYPFCGASPDAITTCDCCGTGTVEIKCPWLLRNGAFNAYLKRRECPFVETILDNGLLDYEFKEDHEYYYQVQMLIFVTNSDFCDFVVWQPPPSAAIVKRVFKNEPFWQEKYAKASDIFQKVLLPELLGNYYSKKKVLRRK